MAKKPPSNLHIGHLIDSAGAADLIGVTRSRLHQLVEARSIPRYIFIDGELVQAEGNEHQGKITLFDRYDVAPLRSTERSKGGRPRKSSKTNLTTSL